MTYKNTYRKFLWLTQYMKILKEQIPFKATDLYLDEMETIHHTKCKPLSIALFVSENYKILDMGVAQMPAKGRLAHFSIEKYGIRPDERTTVRRLLADKVQKNLINSPQVIRTDANPGYPPLIQEFFPTLKHEVFNREQKVRHQEKLHEKLHKTVYDPLFPLNQRCAKLRSDIKRLTRRSWCTTKKIENLQGHLDLYLVSQYLS